MNEKVKHEGRQVQHNARYQRAEAIEGEKRATHYFTILFQLTFHMIYDRLESNF